MDDDAVVKEEEVPMDTTEEVIKTEVKTEDDEKPVIKTETSAQCKISSIFLQF